MSVACGVGFTTTVTEQGDMWTFCAGGCGMLRLGTDTDQQMPVCVQENDEVHRDEQCGCEIQSLELNVPQGLEAAGCYQHALGSRPVEWPEQIAGYVV